MRATPFTRWPAWALAALALLLPAGARRAWAGDEATGDWGGLRTGLEGRGVSVGLGWIGEGFRNFEGGINGSDFVGASNLDLSVTVDTEKAWGWPGGKLYGDLEYHGGRDPSTALTGDLQVFDKLNSARYLQMFELYYEQRLLEDTVRIKIGKVDANTEYSVIDNGLDFIDSSTQVTPTLLAFPTTPDPLPGANLFLTPRDYFYASFGAYLANQRDRFLNFQGDPEGIQPTRDGGLFIGETGVRWRSGPGGPYENNLKLGFWGHTGTFDRLVGGRQKGARGWYAIIDQTLWKPRGGEDETRGVRMFLEYGETDREVSAIHRHGGGGIAWRGLLPGRDGDEIGFSPECAFLSSEAGLRYSHEIIYEGFYRATLAPWMTVQPDVQYIEHPGGRYANGLVGMVQVAVQF